MANYEDASRIYRKTIDEVRTAYKNALASDDIEGLIGIAWSFACCCISNNLYGEVYTICAEMQKRFEGTEAYAEQRAKFSHLQNLFEIDKLDKKAKVNALAEMLSPEYCTALDPYLRTRILAAAADELEGIDTAYSLKLHEEAFEAFMSYYDKHKQTGTDSHNDTAYADACGELKSMLRVHCAANNISAAKKDYQRLKKYVGLMFLKDEDLPNMYEAEALFEWSRFRAKHMDQIQRGIRTSAFVKAQTEYTTSMAKAVEAARRISTDDQAHLAELLRLYAVGLYNIEDDFGALKAMEECLKLKLDYYMSGFDIADRSLRSAFMCENDKNIGGTYLEFGLMYLQNAGRAAEGQIPNFYNNISEYKTLAADSEFFDAIVSSDIDAARASDGGETSSEKIRREFELRRKSGYRDYIERVGLADIQSALKPNEGILDYYLCTTGDGNDFYVLAAISKTYIKWSLLGDRTEIANRRTRWITDIKSQKDDAGSRKDVQKALMNSELLREQRITKLYICTDGELHMIPFELISEGRQISYLTSAKDIVRKHASPVSNGLISVFASPKFSDDNTGGQSRNTQQFALSPLPSSLAEAGAIHQVYGEKSKLFVGRQASAQAFMQNCQTDVIHISTHGSDFEGGRIYFAGGDSYLTANDIARLDLSKTRLVVLSACFTASGRYFGRYGTTSVRRAFMRAGASSMIATLWEVSDLGAAVLMQRFYTAYYRSGNAAAALDIAKDFLKNATAKQIDEDWKNMGFWRLMVDNGYRGEYMKMRALFMQMPPDYKPFEDPYFWSPFVLYE